MVLLGCGTVLGLLLWADLHWDASLYLGSFSLTHASVVFYILYGIIGGIGFMAILGLVACCCSKKSVCLMTVYAVICIVFHICNAPLNIITKPLFTPLFVRLVLSIILIAWISAYIYVLVVLKDRMVDELQKYKGEYATNPQSIGFNVLFVALKTCGVDSYKDFNKYKINPPSQMVKDKAYPLTCCIGLLDQVSGMAKDLENKQMDQNAWQQLLKDEQQFFNTCLPNPDGGYPVLKKLLLILFLVVLAVLVALVIFMTVLVCAACGVIKDAKGGKGGKGSKGSAGSKKK